MLNARKRKQDERKPGVTYVIAVSATDARVTFGSLGVDATLPSLAGWTLKTVRSGQTSHT